MNKTPAPTAAPVVPGDVKAAPTREPKAKKVKKEKVARIAYPGEKLTVAETPADFDASKHKPLKKTNFAAEHLFMLWRANEMAKTAEKLKKDAADMEALGGGAASGKAKKMLQMWQKMQELAKTLGEGDGAIDLEKALGGDMAKALGLTKE
jgi:hypothetical protein